MKPKTASELIDFLYTNQSKIAEWFDRNNFEYHLYNSVDIRRSNYKIAPVDNNLFPAGFNNISENEILLAKTYANAYINSKVPHAKKILICAESHSRNLHYIDNVIWLSKIFDDFEVTVTHPELTEDIILTGNSGKSITYKYITDTSNYDIIILNNDLSHGVPELLANHQFIIPSKKFGWYNRSKISHFQKYTKIAKDFAEFIGIDYRQITTSARSCCCINFKEKSGIDCVANHSRELLDLLKKEYEEMGIKDSPYLFIKADKGTYGMGVMTIRDPDEILNINKDVRKKMATLKEGVQNKVVIIQEGIPTTVLYNNQSAEGMVYMINGNTISTFLRVNNKKDANSNLNSPGMFFSKKGLDEKEKFAYEVIAKLSANASFKELD